MENLILTTLSADEFRSIIREELEALKVKDFTNEIIILTQDELAEKLNLTVPTLIRWRAKGKIPFLNIGSAIRFDLNKVLAAIEKKKR